MTSQTPTRAAAQYSVPSYLHFTLLLSAQLFHHCLSITTCVLMTVTPSCLYPFNQICSAKTYLTYKLLWVLANWMTSNLLCLSSSKTEFLLLDLQSQLNKIQNPTLHLNSGISVPSTASTARNLGFIFDSNLTFSDQVSAISRACFYLSYSWSPPNPSSSRFQYSTCHRHIICSL